jgi:hypothetical protein
MANCPTCQTFRGAWDENCSKCGFSYKELDAQKSAAAAKAADAGACCPACGAARRDGEDTCAACGIVYAKWKPREQRASVAPVAASPSPVLDKYEHRERPGCLTLMMAATVLVNAALAALPFMISMPKVDPWPMVIGALMVSTFAVGVLRWKRWGVYGIYFIQTASLAVLFLANYPVWFMIQPAVFRALVYYFVNPIFYYFD